MRNLINLIALVTCLTLWSNSLYSQQSTGWTVKSANVWESLSSDGLVRIEASVGGGTSIEGLEVMGCTGSATYSDAAIFGSTSLEIEVDGGTLDTVQFSFFDTDDNQVYIIAPILHVDRVGAAALLGASTGVFTMTNGTWTELSSNGTIFESNANTFNANRSALLNLGADECGSGTNPARAGGSLQINSPVQSINMSATLSGGLIAGNEVVEFVLSNLIIAEPSLETTKTVVENFSTPIATGDTVDYVITVENTGNVPVDNITLNDNLTDVDGNALSIGTITYTGATLSSAEGHLEVDEIATYTVTYSLNQPEIDSGGIINQVTASGTALFGSEIVTDISDDGDDTDLNIEDDPTESFFPAPEDDSTSVDEDSNINILVTANDDFSGNGPSSTTIVIATNPSNGTASVNDNGSSTNPIDDFIEYTPAADFNGTDTFTYIITDTKGYAADATVTITVNPIADAVDDSFTVDEDTVLSEDVSTSDTHTTATTYALNTDATNGTVLMATDGTFTYTPDADFNGTDSFTYDVTDINSLTETATVTITVNPIADAVDDTFSTDEDTVLNEFVSTSDTHTTATTYVLNTDASNGTVTLNSDGTFTYTPNADFNGTDSFTYDVTDINADTETATVTITVNPIADAVDDSFSTDEDTVLNEDVSTSDTHTNATTYALNTDATNGTVVMASDGTFTYTPDADFNGTDSFTYDVTDINALTETATVTITVNPIADAVDDTFSTDEDTVLSEDVSTSDTHSTATTYALNADATNGAVVMAADGTFTYTPDADFNGTDSFTYDVTDINALTETATVSITVNPIADAVDDSFTVDEDTVLNEDVSTNDTHTTATTYALNTDASNGTVVIASDGTFTYTPNADFNGTDSFTYDVTDINSLTETATVTITVNPIADAVDDSFTVDEDTVLNEDVSTSDTHTTATTYALKTDASNGTVVMATDGTFTYTPDADFNGTDSFTYDVTDINGATETATVTITVNPIADAVDDSFTVDEDTALSEDVSTSDTHTTATTYALNTDATNGAVVMAADGTFTYTPNADFNGTDSFTYDVTDINSLTETATVTITVNPIADAVDDSFTVDEDTVLNEDVSTSDTHTTATTYALKTDASNGTVVMATDGTFTYTPDADFNGTDSFTYDVTDINALTETATVTITVNPIADAVDDTFSVNEDTVLSEDVSTSDTHTTATSYVLNTDASNGTVVMAANGTFTYTPDADFNGTDSFTYDVTDINSLTETATVTITVNPIADAVDDAFSVDEDTVLNDDVSTSDSHTTATSYALNTDASNGAVIMASDGTFTYTPDADFNGTDSFTYDVTDINALTETATVTITVNPIADAVDDSFTVDEDTILNEDVSTSDTHTAATTYALNTDATNGTVVMASDGTFTYTLDADFNGTDSFTYDVTDINADTETATVTITVNPIADAVDDSFSTDEDTVLSEDVSTSDTHTTATTYALNTNASNGAVIMASDGTFTYTPDADFNGTDSFTYDVTDINADTETATVTITVNPIADAVDDTFSTDEDTVLNEDVSTSDTHTNATTYALNTDATNGTVVMASDGTFTYTPDADFNGTDSFTYDVTDINALTETATVTITVNPIADAVDDSFTVDEDTVLSEDVSTSDTHTTATTYALNADATNGTVVMAADGTFTYTPDADFNGTDSFTYDVTDINGATETATVTITVNPIADAVDDSFTVDEDTVLSEDVSTSDTHTTATTYALNADATNGTVVMAADGTFTYTPDADFNGTDSFTHDVTDINAATETATVTITVNPIADAVDDTFSVDEDMVLNEDVSTSDTHTTATTYALKTDASNGTVVMATDGTFTYTPDADFNGTDSFTYDVTDINALTETATVTITVNPIADAVDDTFSTDEDTVLSEDVSTSDTHTTATTYALNTDATNGTVVMAADGTFTYTPVADFNGTDSFTYDVEDINGLTEIASVSITINPISEAVNDTYTVDEDTVLNEDVSTNDTHSTVATYTLNTNVTNGNVIIAANGTFNYTPNADYNGTDSFTYNVTDINSLTETATVTITVSPIADTVDDTFSTNEDTTLNEDVSTNDLHTTATIYVLNTDAANGTAVIQNDGTFSYSPNPNFTGNDFFTYDVTDINGLIETATVNITVIPVNNGSPLVPVLNINPITTDNIINEAEATTIILVSGMVTGDFNAGDIVTLTVNEVQFTQSVDASGAFEILISGNELVLDSDSIIAGILSTSDTFGNTGTATTQHQYDVLINAPVVNSFTTPDSSPIITGFGSANEILTIQIDFNQDSVFDVTYNVTTDSSGNWQVDTSAAIPETGTYSDMPSGTILDITATDQAGNEGAGRVIIEYVVDLDTDNDGLLDTEEEIIGTDPNNPDTDGDRINDGQEVLDGTDPLDPCDSFGGTPPPDAPCDIYIENDMVNPSDLMNGKFEIINVHLFPENSVEIHNRWGQLVWQTETYDNVNNAFDGNSKGQIAIPQNKKLPSGVYFYRINYVSNNEDKVLKGYLYINR
ncbi:tandem-95 repeat protein [Aurantibacter crassamenti]|uniref:Ig-like domain-containing protein n=1 Tax=Aurantibacter crassamenti TaxID=1837375 RepID=UPI001939D8F6|nr:Ig-like domain-containing protein [Aurantibacter crassamenti]MBM1106429.1 tandem-95 repeat protein [Aurantibacter crassamenti]